MLEGTDTLQGCVSYVVAKDADNENDIWITEIWEDAASHAASLNLPQVVASIGKAMPLIDMAAPGLRHETIPVGGKGIA